MVRAMLASPQFFSAKAYRGRIKSPVEFVVGSLRGLGVQTDAKGLPALLEGLGQMPLDPPNVSGWDGDKASAAWVSTQNWMSRVNYINELVAVATGAPLRGGGAGNASSSAVQRTVAVRKIGTGKALVDYYVAALLDNQLDASRRAVLHDAVGRSATGPALPLAGGGTLPAASVRTMLYLLMSMPEYQLN
jgi:hypothetical protein